MNPFLKRLPKIPAIFNNHCKLTTRNTNQQRNIYRLINEPPVPFKNMWPHERVNHEYFSTNASSGYRNWKNCCPDKPGAQEPGVPFKIVSYNILAQDLLLGHLELYTRSRKNYLKWNYRLDRLKETIVEQRPDIICLQEVQQDHLEDIKSSIQSRLPSMSCIFQKKTGVKTDGCAIFYNSNLFDLVLWDVVEFYRPDIQLLDRHNIALITKFKCKSENLQANLLVSTTHLLFNPRRQDVRLAQIMVLLAELDRHSLVKPGKSHRMPIILTGDFNFDANSAPFELITTGKLCYERLTRTSLTSCEGYGSQPTGKKFISEKLGITDTCQHIDSVQCNNKNIPQNSKDNPPKDSNLFSTGTLTHALNLCSAYNHYEGVAYASIFQGKWVAIDHLFYSLEDPKKPKHKTAVLKLMSIYTLPTVRQCKQIGSLPNVDHGSDHLMLAACFYLKFPVSQ
ncbi:protein angel [Eupeodes corollae]|uniref:protein angel n=1 Tax=Eupeodes corollae TaxID=290404 RepID=UPI002492068E|nr:protein angel [Eupeodes corollae]